VNISLYLLGSLELVVVWLINYTAEYARMLNVGLPGSGDATRINEKNYTETHARAC